MREPHLGRLGEPPPAGDRRRASLPYPSLQSPHPPLLPSPASLTPRFIPIGATVPWPTGKRRSQRRGPGASALPLRTAASPSVSCALSPRKKLLQPSPGWPPLLPGSPPGNTSTCLVIMDPKHSAEVSKHLDKQNQALMETYREMSHELHKLQVEEETIMRKLYELMSAEGLLPKRKKEKQQEEKAAKSTLESKE